MTTVSYRDVREALSTDDQGVIEAAIATRRKGEDPPLPDRLQDLALNYITMALQRRTACPSCGRARPEICLTDVRGRLPGYTFVGDCCWVQWVREGSEINGAPMTRERWFALAQGKRTEAA